MTRSALKKALQRQKRAAKEASLVVPDIVPQTTVSTVSEVVPSNLPLVKGVWIAKAQETEARKVRALQQQKEAEELLRREQEAKRAEEQLRTDRDHEVRLLQEEKRKNDRIKEETIMHKWSEMFKSLGMVNGYQVLAKREGKWLPALYVAESKTVQNMQHELNGLLSRISRCGHQERLAFRHWRLNHKHGTPRPYLDWDRTSSELRAAAIALTTKWNVLWIEYLKDMESAGYPKEFDLLVTTHRRKMKDLEYAKDSVEQLETGSSENYYYYPDVYSYSEEEEEEEEEEETKTLLLRERIHRAMLCEEAYLLFTRLRKLITLSISEHYTSWNGLSYSYQCHYVKRLWSTLPTLLPFSNFVTMPGVHISIPFFNRYHSSQLILEKQWFMKMIRLFPVYGTASTIHVVSTTLDQIRQAPAPHSEQPCLNETLDTFLSTLRSV